jgi:hypothetical protein
LAARESEYQSTWLLNATTPLTPVERAINEALPLVVAIAALLVVLALLAEIVHTVRQRVWPRPGAFVAVLILAGTIGIAGFQITKNFYEAGLPLLVLAVVAALPSLTNLFGRAAVSVVVAGALLAVISQAALISRFTAEVPRWHAIHAARAATQPPLHRVIERCGIKDGPSTHEPSRWMKTPICCFGERVSPSCFR